MAILNASRCPIMFSQAPAHAVPLRIFSNVKWLPNSKIELWKDIPTLTTFRYQCFMYALIQIDVFKDYPVNTCSFFEKSKLPQSLLHSRNPGRRPLAFCIIWYIHLSPEILPTIRKDCIQMSSTHCDCRKSSRGPNIDHAWEDKMPFNGMILEEWTLSAV